MPWKWIVMPLNFQYKLRRILGFPINIKTSHLHDKEAYPSPVMDGVLLLLLLLLLLPGKCELPRVGGRGDENPTTVLQGAVAMSRGHCAHTVEI